MIFVTVGTHEQQFNRLIMAVDELKSQGLIKEEVFMQIGYTTYEPKHCQFKRLISYDEMNHYIEKSSLVISHGGPATFMYVLSKGKTVLVVPRLKKYDEHINDHQLEFVKIISSRYDVSYIEDISQLKVAISQMDKTANQFKSNHVNFCHQLEKIIFE